MVKTRQELLWRKKHLENMLWSAKNPKSLFGKKDIPRFERELKHIKKALKKQ